MNVLDTDACRHCRRPIELVEGVGALHAELPQYAGETITCENPVPVTARKVTWWAKYRTEAE